MIQNKCKHCKYYKEGLDIDYVPSCWCKLDNFNNAEICEHDKEEYTFNDYIEEQLPGIIFVLFLAGAAFIISLMK